MQQYQAPVIDFSFNPYSYDVNDHFITESPNSSPPHTFFTEQSLPNYHFFNDDLNTMTQLNIQSLSNYEVSSPFIISNAEMTVIPTAPVCAPAPVSAPASVSVPHVTKTASKGKKKTGRTRSTKKRKRNAKEDVTNAEDTGDEDVSFVYVPRDDLLKMSSKQLEARVEQLKAQREFTQAELNEIQRQRRLIKNREYAQTSRSKKNDMINTLKDQLAKVHSENEILKIQVCSLNERSKLLEQENKLMRSLLGQPPVQFDNNNYQYQIQPPNLLPIPPTQYYNPSPSSPGSPSVSSDESLSVGSSDECTVGLMLDDPLSYPSNTEFETKWEYPNMFTTGMCLLAVLFSFGLFFNTFPGISPMMNRGKMDNGRTTGRALFQGTPGEDDISETTVKLERKLRLHNTNMNVLWHNTDHNASEVSDLFTKNCTRSQVKPMNYEDFTSAAA